MNLNQKQTDALLGIFEYEQTHDSKEFSLGWSWAAVRVPPATLNNLLLKGLIEEKFHSNSYRGLLDFGGGKMVRVLEYLEVTEVKGEKVYKCLKCGHVLGSAKEDYKNFAKKRTVPASKNQPAYLATNSDYFVMREYCCPKCAVMFEVDYVAKDESQIHSIEL